ELPARAAEVLLVGAEDVERHRERRHEAPTVPLEAGAVARIVREHRELERLLRPARQVDELLPLVVLAPPIDVALELDVLALLTVVAYRREVRQGGVVEARPEVEVDRLARLAVAHAVERDAAIVCAVVLAVGDDRVVV